MSLSASSRSEVTTASTEATSRLLHFVFFTPSAASIVALSLTKGRVPNYVLPAFKTTLFMNQASVNPFKQLEKNVINNIVP